MDGVEFVKRLEHLKLDTRIVLMSGNSPEEVQKILGKETAAYRSMWKPFEASTLVQMVKNVLAAPAAIGGDQKGQAASLA